MRNIKSAGYFEQMKGRGCRVIGSDALQGVTPDAPAKTHFIIVDAVGVCEQEKSDSKPLDRKPSVPLERLLNTVATGVAEPDIASTLASRLTRLDRQLNDEQRREIGHLAGGVPLPTLSARLLESIDADAQVKRAVEKFGLPEGAEPDQKQIEEVEREMVAAALRPFHNPALRNRLVTVTKTLEQVVDEVSQDELLDAGFSQQAQERALGVVTGFRRFIEENKEELEAIQVLYSRPYRASLRYRHVKDLAAALRNPPLGATPDRVWQAFQALEPQKVRGQGGRQLVDLIALVRHALEPDTTLVPFAATVEERYHRWLEERKSAGVTFTSEQRRWLDAIKDHIASCLRIEADDFEEAPFSQLGGLGRAHDLFGDRLEEIMEDLNMRLAA